jgi:hypothetical protein
MAETLMVKLKALEAHIAMLQKMRAQTTTEADTWRKVREQLERIVPRPNGDPPPKKRVEITDVLWGELRAELEAFRLKIRAELDAHHSGKPLAGNAHRGRRMDPEQQDEQRRHERPAADPRHPHQQATDKPADRVQRIYRMHGRLPPLGNVATEKVYATISTL